MKRSLSIITIFGSILLIIVLIIFLTASRSSPSRDISVPSTNYTGTNTEDTTESNQNLEEDTSPAVSDEALSGELYRHQELVFRIPPHWIVQTEGEDAKVVLAQPEGAASLYSLPRLLINIDAPTKDPDYLPFQERYQNHTVDQKMTALNSNVKVVYRSTHPYPGDSEEIHQIQELVAILQSEKEYRIHFQYDSQQPNTFYEEMFVSIIESLEYQ